MRILFLEDNEQNAEIYGDHLRQAGYAIDHVITLEDAAIALLGANYDLLLLDRQVPDGDSRVWLSQLRKDGLTIPALFMTVRDAIEDRIEGLDAGADDYVPKPVAPAELVARLRAILRRPQTTLLQELSCGGLSLDPANRQASVSGNPIKLSKRELMLLEHLLRRAGNVVTKESLEEGLYGYGEEVTPNSLEVAIYRLRKRLEEAESTAEIHTIRGVGYLIRERLFN